MLTLKYEYIDKNGSFRTSNIDGDSGLYLPIAGENGLKGCVTPLLGGDSKIGQNEFLLQPTTEEDLYSSKCSRNFWCRLEGTKVWSATGNSAEQIINRMKNIDKEECYVEAGFMWQKQIRKNKSLGIASDILSFVPYDEPQAEIMRVTITNLNEYDIKFDGIVAIPLYGKSADNIRDHRHVTSLLNRVNINHDGILLKPTLSFDERGHQINRNIYGVVGHMDDGTKPSRFYADIEEFIGEDGDLLAPKAVYSNVTGSKPGDSVEGYDAIGGLEFDDVLLGVNESKSFIIILGVYESREEFERVSSKYSTSESVEEALSDLKSYWTGKINVHYSTGNTRFDQWMNWINFQPILRRIYGCSFLPHHDYGKGGRGWRDLWQDSLALLVIDPRDVRKMLVDNFQGVRIDGSNATIIGNKSGEFIADRNNITRVWMDHGVWPFITVNSYINYTGDTDILFEKISYFKDKQINRGERKTRTFEGALVTEEGKTYLGTVLEHILVENMTAYFDVGAHCHIRLRGADWNDAIDMASEKGESVAFTAAYAGNLREIASLLKVCKSKYGIKSVELFKEIDTLMALSNEKRKSAKERHTIINEYYTNVCKKISGKTNRYDIDELCTTLNKMSDDLMNNIRSKEWVGEGEDHWYNGYYDNSGKQVEGGDRMMLTSQVFMIMSGTATDDQMKEIIDSIDKYLFSPEIGGYRLNTNFNEVKLDMGRMFGFAYGHKENGAVFSHMAVMYANALYKRNYAKEAYKVIKTLFDQCENSEVSKIYPGIPEYFNEKGQGMYPYLTGAASWLMMTILNESFGIKYVFGKLFLSPKLVAEQFNEEGFAEVVFFHDEKEFLVIYENKEKLEFGEYRIGGINLNGCSLICDSIEYEIPDCRIMSQKNRIHLQLVKRR